jgi:hypothetical protein
VSEIEHVHIIKNIPLNIPPSNGPAIAEEAQVTWRIKMFEITTSNKATADSTLRAWLQ